MHGPRHSRSVAETQSRPQGTAAPTYHPEFGYLCPSVAVLQSVRVAMISVGVGILIGAGIASSLAEREFAGSQRNEQSLTSQAGDQATSATARAVGPENPAPVANRNSASMRNNWEACKDEGEFFLNQECRLIRKHRAHARSTAESLRPASASVSGNSAQAENDPSSLVVESPDPSTATPGKTNARAAKPARNVRIRERSREPKDDPGKAFAYAFSLRNSTFALVALVLVGGGAYAAEVKEAGTEAPPPALTREPTRSCHLQPDHRRRHRGRPSIRNFVPCEKPRAHDS